MCLTGKDENRTKGEEAGKSFEHSHRTRFRKSLIGSKDGSRLTVAGCNVLRPELKAMSPAMGKLAR
jgi:hypothetical protein